MYIRIYVLGDVSPMYVVLLSSRYMYMYVSTCTCMYVYEHTKLDLCTCTCTPSKFALFRHLAEQKPPEPTPDRPDGAEDEPEGTSAAGQEEELGRAHQTEVEATPERSGSPPTRAATESVPQSQESMEEGQSQGPNSVIDVRMFSILQAY